MSATDPRYLDVGPPPLGGAGVLGWAAVIALAAAPGVRLLVGGIAGNEPPSSATGAALAFAVATLAAAWSLRRQLRSRAPWWIAVMIAPTTLGAAVHEGRLEVWWMAATALALGLVFRTEHVSADRLDDIYQQPDAERRGLAQIRWLLVGGLLALPLAHQPTLLPLFLAGIAIVPPSHARSGRVAVALGGVLGGGIGLAITGAGSWRELALNIDPSLLWWSAVDLAFGRHIGIAVIFFPVLLAILGAERERTRQRLLAGAGLSLALALLLRPFDQWGGAADTMRITSFTMVPLLPAFWFQTARPRRSNAPLTLAVAAVVGVVLCGPLWPVAWQGSPPPERSGLVLRLAERVRGRLPIETTQQSLQPFTRGETLFGELFLRRVDVGRGEPWTLRPGLPTTLLVAAPSELTAVIVEVEAGGPSQLVARGAEVVQMAYRPDGGTAFQLSPDPTRVSHRAWWSSAPQRYYVFRLIGFGEEAGPAGFTVRTGEL